VIANSEIVTGVIVFLIGYFLGSIPTAYIATRLATGRDIRKIGGGNVGGLNTYREVGIVPAVVVGIVDVGKGAAAVAIAYWLLDLEPVYVYLAGGAAVAGHNWMVWLKFSGGKGMGASIGALAVLMPIYGYAIELGILLAIIVVPMVTIRNVALAMGIGLIALPFIAWLMGEHSGMFVVWSVVVGLMVVAKFAPTALASIAKSKGLRDFIRGD
jgi:glycerol-3-phosphate acyltransferase PlsY